MKTIQRVYKSIIACILFSILILVFASLYLPAWAIENRLNAAKVDAVDTLRTDTSRVADLQNGNQNAIIEEVDIEQIKTDVAVLNGITGFYYEGLGYTVGILSLITLGALGVTAYLLSNNVSKIVEDSERRQREIEKRMESSIIAAQNEFSAQMSDMRNVHSRHEIDFERLSHNMWVSVGQTTRDPYDRNLQSRIRIAFHSTNVIKSDLCEVPEKTRHLNTIGMVLAACVTELRALNLTAEQKEFLETDKARILKQLDRIEQPTDNIVRRHCIEIRDEIERLLS